MDRKERKSIHRESLPAMPGPQRENPFDVEVPLQIITPMSPQCYKEKLSFFQKKKKKATRREEKEIDRREDIAEGYSRMGG